MTTYFLLIIAGNTIDEHSRFYKIKVGSTAADKAGVHALKVLASSRQWYFAPYTHGSADFLLRVAISLSRMPDDLNMTIVPVRTFLHAWKEFSKTDVSHSGTVNQEPTSSKRAHHQRKRLPQAVLQRAECVRRSKPQSVETDFTEYLNNYYSH